MTYDLHFILLIEYQFLRFLTIVAAHHQTSLGEAVGVKICFYMHNGNLKSCMPVACIRRRPFKTVVK